MLLTLIVAVLGTQAQTPSAGSEFDAAPFGQIWHFSDQGLDYGVFWEDSRDIYRLEVTFEGKVPEDLHIEYWVSQWPLRRPPRDRPSGAGSSGWLELGDWHRGRWRRADTSLKRTGSTCIFTFRPLSREEFPKLKNFPVTYRRTLKIRVVGSSPLPPVKAFKAFTDSTWEKTRFVFLSGGGQVPSKVEVFNGFTLSVSKEGQGALRGEILYARTKRWYCFDETVVTLRLGENTFSFAVRDLLKEPYIYLPDFNFLVKRPEVPVTLTEARTEWLARRGRSIYRRVFEAPEQTLTGAWNDTPPKTPHDMPLSFPGTRQHFRIDELGRISCHTNWISRLRGKDTDRCLWKGQTIRYRLGVPQRVVEERTLREGWLPVVTALWRKGRTTVRQTAFAAPLNGVPPEGSSIWADDTMVCFVRLEIENPQAPIKIPIVIEDAAGPQKLKLKGSLIQAVYKAQAVPRAFLKATAADKKGEIPLELSGQEEKSGLLLLARPQAAACIRVDFVIPFVTLRTEGELRLLGRLDFDRTLKLVEDYWKRKLEGTCLITTPEPMINDFYRAYLTHVLINTEREVGVSDRYMAKVGTFYYGVYSNESCMMISELDRRGLHELAARALETFLYYQATVALPGDYSTKEGIFYGAGGYEAGGYNQHHGWVLWALGEHYFLTGDKVWLRHATPHILRALRWIAAQRKRTDRIASTCPIRRIERGLLPQGRLEDIGDWRTWLSTNVFTWWGMKRAVQALRACGHPEAGRWEKETEDYGKAILEAFGEARRRSPVVKLRDGSFIPHVPPEVHRRGRTFGWITETLEGAFHMVRCSLVRPDSQLATWILKDYEDNLYLSKQFGYYLEPERFERFWFSHGGISMQANLLPNALPYLYRDEIKHFLRACFNAFAVSYFPDTRMMTEHALPEIGSWRGDHFKASDEANWCQLLRLMFVREAGETLLLGQAIPRAWFKGGEKFYIKNARTKFGTISVTFVPGRNKVRVLIEPSFSRPPAEVILRVRHPSQRPPVRISAQGVRFQTRPGKEEIVLPPFSRPLVVTFEYSSGH